jgi:hypothetical protein
MRTLLLTLLLATGCKGDGEACGTSVGACAYPNGNCSIDMNCRYTRRSLVCTSPAPDAKTTDCTCNENGVIGKKVTLEVSHGGPFAGNERAIVKSACGWE